MTNYFPSLLLLFMLKNYTKFHLGFAIIFSLNTFLPQSRIKNNMNENINLAKIQVTIFFYYYSGVIRKICIKWRPT